MKTRLKPLTITEILKSKDYSMIEKKVAWEKWKFNQCPELYRKYNKKEVLDKIHALKI